MEGADLDLVCQCAYENFERVIVQRKPGSPIVTDFVACVGCKAMYFVPVHSTYESEDRRLKENAKIAAAYDKTSRKR